MRKILPLGFLFLLLSQAAIAELLTFNFTTNTTGQSFAPRHVLAVWIEKNDGTFVKTLYLRANARKKYLYTWKNRSGNNSTDAITGSTLNSHGNRTVYWNGRDLTGNAAPSGIYKIKVEFTERHAQGPLLEVAFNKDTSVVNLTPANQSNYSNISLHYDPLMIGMESHEQLESAMQVFPNPANNFIQVSLNMQMLQYGELNLYSIDGKNLWNKTISDPNTTLQIKVDVADLPTGIYFLVYTSKEQILRKKILIH